MRPFFIMHKRTQRLTQGALIGAIYVTLSYLQNLLLPGSGSWAIQFRIAEALCVLAFFTPAAIPGLSIGCLLFNLSSAALPLDAVIGTGASALSAAAMWLLRKHPALGLCMPILFNGLLVGWELTVFLGGTFPLNALYVAFGEAAVMLTLGNFLYFGIRRRRLEQKLC